MNSVIVLNADGNYINTVSWEDAMCLLYKGVAQVVQEGKRIVRTVTKEYIVPMIIRLVKQVRAMYGKAVPWSRQNLFTRDKFTCQYCGTKVNAKTAQVEHVVPRSKGGKTSFENCTTSCHSCNQKKADRLPEVANMYPRKKPYHPTINEFIQLKMNDLNIWNLIK